MILLKVQASSKNNCKTGKQVNMKHCLGIEVQRQKFAETVKF
jgi:hypothetical protein